ncbi:sugar phosphate isomerase/epimerase [Eubacteriales bacterium OttesenSCG-928-N13]|nr:sugar phosphate isomerase/epimerase [Eubacteriales bacterium OttesenSCG-928-N13]
MYKAFNPRMVALPNVTFDETIALAAQNGFSAIEFDPIEIVSQHGLNGSQDIMAKSGVTVSSFGLPVNVQAGAAQFDETFGKLESYARAASALGIRRSCTYIFSWSDELPFAENFRVHVKRLRACAEVYKDYGIQFGLEFLGPQTLYVGKAHEFIHTLSGMLELCDAVGTGNMGIMLDAYHMYSAGMDVTDLSAFSDESQIVTVHINDAKKGQSLETLPDTLRYLPGEGGGIDLKGFLSALESFGYTGPVIVEPFSEKLKAMDDPAQIAKIVGDSIQSVWVS